MTDRIARLLDLDRDEARRALSLAGVLFALIGSYTLVKTARDAKFLAQLPADTLPYVYLAVGVLTTVAAAVFTRATQRKPTWRTLEGSVLVVAVALAAFAYLFHLQADWVPIAFYLWVNVYGLILISQFWAFTNSVSHPREAKRIFGVVGTGGILGGLFGGLVAPSLALTWNLPSLLVAAALLVALVAPWVRSSALGAEAPRAEPAGPVEGEAENPARHPYLRWLALATLCSVLVTTLLDYLFKVELQRRYPSSEALASFLGLFYTATNLAALTMQFFATRWSLQTLGAGWSAAVLPAGLGLGAVATMLAPGFAPVIASRLWDQVMRLSVNRTAVELFYFPLEPGLRRRAKALIQAGLERLGDALAGLLILAVGALMVASTPTLAGLVAALVIVWMVAWLNVRRGYVTELGRNLRRMNLEHEKSTVSLREASLLGEMTRLLDSPYERNVLRGLDMLEQNAPEELRKHLGRLLTHRAAKVRARALSLGASIQEADTRSRLASLMEDDDSEVRIEALRAYGALGGGDRLATLRGYIDSDEPLLRRTALQCLAEYATPAEEDEAWTLLEPVLRRGAPEDRAAVAEGLGQRASPSRLHDLIAPLLEDSSLEVRNAGLVSAGRAQQRMLVPKLIEALGPRETQSAARAGLVAFGDRVVGTLSDYLCDAGVPMGVRREIPRVLGSIATQEAVNALFRCREREDVRLAYRVLKAANRIRAVDQTLHFPRRLIGEDLEHDVRSYLFALVHYRACPIGETLSAERLLCLALNERMEQALNRAFRSLALVYPPRDIYAAYRGTISEDPRARGNALEYLENALAPDHRLLVLPLLDDSGDEARLRFAEVRYGLRFVGFTETLAEMLQGGDPWLRTCALYVVGKRRERTLLGRVEVHLSSMTPYVRETARWARAALAAS